MKWGLVVKCEVGIGSSLAMDWSIIAAQKQSQYQVLQNNHFTINQEFLYRYLRKGELVESKMILLEATGMRHSTVRNMGQSMGLFHYLYHYSLEIYQCVLVVPIAERNE